MMTIQTNDSSDWSRSWNFGKKKTRHIPAPVKEPDLKWDRSRRRMSIATLSTGIRTSADDDHADEWFIRLIQVMKFEISEKRKRATYSRTCKRVRPQMRPIPQKNVYRHIIDRDSNLSRWWPCRRMIHPTDPGHEIWNFGKKKTRQCHIPAPVKGSDLKWDRSRRRMSIATLSTGIRTSADDDHTDEWFIRLIQVMKFRKKENASYSRTCKRARP